MNRNYFHLILILIIFPILGNGQTSGQDKKIYKWQGDWGSISGSCPHFCIQRKYIIERNGLPPIQANLVLSHTTWNGSRIQFITLDRHYLWIKEYYDVVRIPGDHFIADAFNQNEAISILMDDAVYAHLREEAERNAASQKQNSASRKGENSGKQSRVIGTEAEQMKMIRDNERILLRKCEEYIASQNYDAALGQVNLAIAIEKNLKVERMLDVTEMEKRVKELIRQRDEKIAADKKKQKEDAAKKEAKKKKLQEKKILFAGNPGNKPYPNPYDNPHPDKPLYVRPTKWKDNPVNIKDAALLKGMVDMAIRNHDGYRLFQLAEHRYLTGIEFGRISDMLQEVVAIARFNRDPWLMYHLADWYTIRHPYKYLPEMPGVYLKEAYDFSILRNDPASMYEIYRLEKSTNLMPELTPEEILKTREAMME